MYIYIKHLAGKISGLQQSEKMKNMLTKHPFQSPRRRENEKKEIVKEIKEKGKGKLQEENKKVITEKSRENRISKFEFFQLFITISFLKNFFFLRFDICKI
jgi:hypothetical protein